MPTPMPTRAEARKSLDAVIRKSRVHLYKPIQIAEILYHDRVYHDVDLNDLETYRNRSKNGGMMSAVRFWAGSAPAARGFRTIYLRKMRSRRR